MAERNVAQLNPWPNGGTSMCTDFPGVRQDGCGQNAASGPGNLQNAYPLDSPGQVNAGCRWRTTLDERICVAERSRSEAAIEATGNNAMLNMVLHSA